MTTQRTVTLFYVYRKSDQLAQSNQQLTSSNQQLSALNSQLSEANRVKEGNTI